MAVRLLGLRAHSKVELGRKLSRRGFDSETISGVLERLADHSYLDDAAFAQAVIRHRGKSRGAIAIRAELAARGVSRQDAADAVDTLDPEEQLAGAERFARSLLPKAEPGSLRSLLEVAGPRLLRRGYPTPVVREACRRALTGDRREAAASR